MTHYGQQHYWYQPGTDSPPAKRIPPPIAGWLALAGGVLMILGAVLPWAELDALFVRITVDGVETDDGKIAVGVGIVAFLGGLFVGVKQAQVWLCWLAAAACMGMAGVLVKDAMDLSGARLGIGIYLAVLGAAVGAVASLTCALGRVEG